MAVKRGKTKDPTAAKRQQQYRAKTVTVTLPISCRDQLQQVASMHGVTAKTEAELYRKAVIAALEAVTVTAESSGAAAGRLIAAAGGDHAAALQLLYNEARQVLPDYTVNRRYDDQERETIRKRFAAIISAIKYKAKASSRP